ncbi:hypothetical protein DYBT9275_03474 [Dyadobacter sp. CECT 9275]|uniref:Activator of Hsp90 ATPase homologue 1/2-like C-terminal domain-containing protein n=1 Tax=Dyadobacter helix TaxID=2822344 RepID=A0A916N6R0_9BACT|nr:SRPBCC domain-containing protein [Dyadobacter sp. CECT 9275]CAG5004915.1 hypothetical protein DYBT9275_03474 [Dyadobacter sp. CECT 9275]
MKRDVKVQWFYPHPPEVIWECLTNQELLNKWTFIKDFKPVVGHEFEAHAKPRKSQGFDGIMYHKVLEVIPLKKLSYTFRGGPQKGVITLDTIVTWTLTPKNGGTELKVEQSGFEGTKNYFTSFIMELGWKKILSKKITKALQTLDA